MDQSCHFMSRSNFLLALTLFIIQPISFGPQIDYYWMMPYTRTTEMYADSSLIEEETTYSVHRIFLSIVSRSQLLYLLTTCSQFAACFQDLSFCAPILAYLLLPGIFRASACQYHPSLRSFYLQLTAVLAHFCLALLVVWFSRWSNSRFLIPWLTVLLGLFS